MRISGLFKRTQGNGNAPVESVHGLKELISTNDKRYSFIYGNRHVSGTRGMGDRLVFSPRTANVFRLVYVRISFFIMEGDQE